MSQYTQGCSIVIVSYNVAAFLYQTIASVVQAAEASVFKYSYEIIVVDNNSADESIRLIEQLADANNRITLIANKHNPGFGKANNQGFKIAQYEHILILNPDTVLAEDVIEVCANFLNTHTEAGAIGIRMIDGAGNYLPESKRGLPTLWNSFTKLSGLTKLFPSSKVFAGYYLGHLSPKEIQEIEVLSGAFIYAKREALEKANFFDEAYFMYGEDIDLSYKITQAGYKNYYLPTTAIIHYKGESTKKGSLNYVKAFYEAMFIFAAKNLKGGFVNFLKPLIYIAIYLKGFFAYINSYVLALTLPLIDGLGIYIGMHFLKTYWEINHKRVPNYYPDSFMYQVVPAYIFMWLFMVWLSGGYGSTKSVYKTVRGILISTALIAAITNFFDDYRFSKALIILGMSWAVFYLTGIRLLLSRFKKLNVSQKHTERKYALVIGDFQSFERARKIYLQNELEAELVGFVSNGKKEFESSKQEQAHLGNLNSLPQVIDLLYISELIFDNNFLSNKQMMALMESYKNEGIAFRTLLPALDAILGSDSKQSSGEVKGLDRTFLINNPEIRRQKRLLDIGLSLALIMLYPFVLVLSKKQGKLFNRLWQVLIGKFSFTALSKQKIKGIKQKPALLYYDEEKASFPIEKELNTNLHSLFIDMEAKRYSVLSDLLLIIKKFKYL